MSGKVLPSKNSRMSSTTTAPTFNLALRTSPPKPRPSLVDDPIFVMLYANNLANLRHVINNKTPLPRKAVLENAKLVEYVQSQEPGPAVQYENIRPALSAVRSFLVTSHQGKQLLSFFKKVLQVQGLYITTSAEVLAFEIFVKLYHSYFIAHNDQKLIDHVQKIVPEARYVSFTCTNADLTYFDMFVATERPRFHGACSTANDNILKMKCSKEFLYMHGRLLTTIEMHEAQLKKARDREIRRIAERRARAQAAFIQNGYGLNRQMGTAGLTAHTQHVEDSVVEFTRETRYEFFPSEGNGEVYSEEPTFGKLLLSQIVVATADSFSL